MKESFSRYLIGVGVGFALGVLLCYESARNRPQPPVKERVDTLYIRDTLTLREPLYIERRVVDSVLIPVQDSVHIHDTLFVVLPRECVEWRDSLCTIYASGISANVDSVRHYITERVVTIERERLVKQYPRFGVGVTAGYGATKDGLSPYIGVGVTFNLITF